MEISFFIRFQSSGYYMSMTRQMANGEKILVAGSTGYLGQYVIQELKRDTGYGLCVVMTKK